MAIASYNMNERFMEETMSDLRLEKIYLEAGRLFNKKGYTNTKVSEIAVAAGVATGTMYNLFSSKEAILSFVIQATLDKDWLKQDMSLPIKQIDVAILQNSLQKVIDDINSSVMEIKDEKGRICKNFSAFVSDIFDMCADYLLAFNNIETNAVVLEELWRVFLSARTNFYKKLETNLKCYMEVGQISQIDYLPLHVENIIHILTWWSVNSYLSMPQIEVTREVAKEIGVGMIVRAYSN